MSQSSNKRIIAVDVDDVLASHALSFVTFSNERWGTHLTIDDYDDDWAKLWQLDREIETHRQIVSDRATVFFEHNTTSMPHDESALEVLVSLKERFDLIVVTARRQQIKGETLAWLQQKYPGVFEDDRIFFAGFYDTIRADSSVRNKGALLKSLHADYLIDDQPKHCNGADEQGIRALLFGDYAWQRNALINPGVKRVGSWAAVREYFNAE
jgi:5'(3')-deoxyribonucleotidase